MQAATSTDRRAITAEMDQARQAFHRLLDHATDTGLRRGMHFPTTWDPFFTGYMTLADLYRYPTQHFNHHRKQLTLTGAG
jgi:uncharacterized damage-inducible protein DinB